MQETLRPLGFGETLDGAFTLLRRNFSVFFGTTLVPQIPILLFWLLAPAMLGPVEAGSTYPEAASLLLSPYSLFAMIVVMGALTHAAAEAYQGERPSIRESLGRGLRRFLPLAVVSIIAWFMIVFGLLLLIVPGLIVAAMYFAVYPAVVIEKRGPLQALGRSRKLSRGARGRILGIIAIAYLISMLPTVAMWMFAGVSLGIGGALSAATLTGTSLWFVGLMQAASIVVTAITWPFLMIVTVLLYYDRRARTEAPDLESAVAELQDNVV